jgi:flavin-dependent dehydrogenase
MPTIEFNELSRCRKYPLNNTDVLVIGGGPAGSTAATLLVERGYQVVLLEKEHHPRFHIGESLLPANLPILARLGVADEVKAIGMQKWGAEFISPWDERHQTFEFAEGWNKSLPYAYQVRRSQFDEILFRRAVRAGAQAIEGCRVREVEFLPGGAGVQVDAAMEDGRSESWRARFLVDASGRDTFLGTRLKAKRRNTKHSSAALYGHFRGARRYTDKRAGDISIYWFEHGWFWFIPLADGTTSVGAVVWPYYTKTRTVPVREFFLATIRLCAPLAERLRAAELVADVTATGNYSYACDRAYGANYLLLGDAYAFIDPMFSSGVMLAMNSAVAGTDTVDQCLREPARAAQALQRFERLMRRGPKAYSWFIYRVTNPTMCDLFMEPRNTLRMKEALLGLLAGDIFGNTPIWTSLRVFKLLYYVVALVNLKRSLGALRRRAANIRPVGPEQMTAK